MPGEIGLPREKKVCQSQRLSLQASAANASRLAKGAAA